VEFDAGTQFELPLLVVYRLPGQGQQRNRMQLFILADQRVVDVDPDTAVRGAQHMGVGGRHLGLETDAQVRGRRHTRQRHGHGGHKYTTRMIQDDFHSDAPFG
jgi:hypothetical protein